MGVEKAIEDLSKMSTAEIRGKLAQARARVTSDPKLVALVADYYKHLRAAVREDIAKTRMQLMVVDVLHPDRDWPCTCPECRTAGDG